MAGIGQKLALIIAGGERTEYAKELNDQMAKVEAMYKHAKTLIDRVRCNTQPNKSHRSESSLCPGEEDNERLRYAAALRDTANSSAILDQTLVSYLKNLADVQEAIEKQHEKFLKQVQAYCIKELRKFAEVTYVELKDAHSELGKRKDAYDLARHKLKSCKPEDVEQRGQAAQAAQRAFEQQATATYDLLQKLPAHELALTKALFIYTRAESDYAKALHELVKNVPNPDRQSSNKSSRQ